MHFKLLASAAAATALALGAAPAAAQRVATPEQRIERLEKQVRQVQRQVFPRGEPADSAGFSDEPAATQTSVRNLDQRLATLERQLSEILRTAEESGHRAAVLEAELARVKADQDSRLRALETAAAAAPPVATTTVINPPVTTTRPRADPVTVSRPPVTPGPATTVPAAEDPAEIAYDEGYQLWRTGRYDAAITSLRAFTSAYPKHRRASWANNLVGRALLDKGEARAAADALLANYRTNPRGERAADSLYYLGQALIKLGQPGQACKAYAELEEVYGASMRGELRTLLPSAKAEAKCG
ncbi:tetratricopeptide repeat protein [Sphingomonas sp.]|uniref:tetratricopeptide repeat protein n=1 Tax=Sphingomonas sp. TaxID=28214 RepID=UPI00286DF182|nr:tetratricopeptide repeat protein [Sphingomonas sp.]